MGNNISFIEKKLNIELPEDYKHFIKTFGYLEVNGQEIYGYTDKMLDYNKIPCVIGATNLYKHSHKLLSEEIVIQSLGFENIIVVLNTKSNTMYEVSPGNFKKKITDSFADWLNNIQQYHR